MTALTFSLSLKENFINDFIIDNRWQWLLSGLGRTLMITVMATILGVVIGLSIAMVKVSQQHG